MKAKAVLFFLFVLFTLPSWANAVSEKDFEVQSTQELINLCTATLEDPLYHQAINFCHGYLVGAYAYYIAAHPEPETTKLVCFPNPQPSRNEAINKFIEWTKGHPQYLKEKPVETEFRFLTETWPCKR